MPDDTEVVRCVVPPRPETIAKYGLTQAEWCMLAESQGNVCAVCGRLPASGRLAIDHAHVPKWKHMAPRERRKHVRGLVCFICNGKCVNKHMTIDKARRVLAYLIAHRDRTEAAT